MKPATIIYDNQCKLCNSAVKFLKAGTGETGMLFVPSGHEESLKIMDENRIAREVAEKTVIFLKDQQIFIKSTAIIKALQNKGGAWKLAGILLLVPAFLRDAVYDWIARNR